MSNPAKSAKEPFFSPALIEDPYPIYKRFREEAEIHYIERDAGPGVWAAFTHSACSQLFRDPRLTAKRTGSLLLTLPEDRREDFAPLIHMLGLWMLFLDPPEHSRLRKLMDKGFSAGVLDELREPVRRIVDGLLDRLHPAAEVDLIADFTHLVPVTVIAGMMGIDAAAAHTMRVWTDSIALFLGNPNRTVADAEAAQSAVLGLTDYFRKAVADRRRNRANDLISLLLQIEDQGDVLTEEEVYAQCVMLLFAGHETTRNLLGNGIYTSLISPFVNESLREEAVDIRCAVEEFLRFETPVQALTRVATEHLEIGQIHIQPGEVIMLLLGSANRDPKCFKEPDHLDLSRRNNPHLAFGSGRHFCIGNQLARLEGQVAIPRALQRFPNVRLASKQPKWATNFLLRGLESLPVFLN